MAGLAGLMPLPLGRPGRALLSWDARPKILLMLVLGCCLWRLPDAALLLLLPLAAALCLLAGGFSGPNRRLWPGGLFFALFWTLAKFALDLAAAIPPQAALAAALPLAARLLTLLCLGLWLALSASPLRMGRAFAWYLSPLLRSRAWQAALALTLMAHFLPLAWVKASGISRALRLRWPDCPWPSRALLIPQALLRSLATDAWTQTLAVAARGLDRPGPWSMARAPRPLEWIAAILPASALLWAAFF